MTLPATGTARRFDPDTAKQAAAEYGAEALNAEQQNVFAALLWLERNGYFATASQVLKVLGGNRQRNCVSRRITDLKQAGMVEDSRRRWSEDRPGARREIVWRVVR